MQVINIDPRINFEAFDGCCAYCNRQTMLLIEHVIPESKGGATGSINCIPACRQCNFAKSNNHPKQWFRRQLFFSEKRWQKILSVLNIDDQYIDLFFNDAKFEYPRIISKLPALMEKQGIDQKTLAARTGLSPTTVGKVYNNHFKAIDTHTVRMLMKHFKLKRLDDLFEVDWEKDDAAN